MKSIRRDWLMRTSILVLSVVSACKAPMRQVHQAEPVQPPEYRADANQISGGPPSTPSPKRPNGFIMAFPWTWIFAGVFICALVAVKTWAAPAFMVVDGVGRPIGMLAFSDGGANNYVMRRVITQAGLQWFGLQVDVNGFVSVGSLPVAWYTNNTCSGSPFIPTGSARFSLVQHVNLINGAVMLPDPNGVKNRTILSYSFGNGGCGTGGTPFTALSTDPLFADQTHYGFVAPFSVVRVP